MELSATVLPHLSLERSWIGPLQTPIGDGGIRVPAIVATRAVVRGPIVLSSGFHAEGEVRLDGAEIGGLDCDDGNFKNAGETALNAEGAKINGAVHLSKGFVAEGEVRLYRAEIGGSLVCDGGSFKNAGKRALYADGAKIGRAIRLSIYRNPDDSLYCNPDGSLERFAAEGEVRLYGAETGGSLICDGGSFKNAGKRALNAEGAKIGRAIRLGNCRNPDGSLYRNPDRSLEGFAAEGEVRLYGAETGGSLNCNGGSFKNAGKRALNATLANIGGSVLFGNGAHTEGDLWFLGTSIGADLNLSGANFAAETPVRLRVVGTDIKGALIIHRLKKGPETEVRISDTSCAVLDDRLRAWPDRGRLDSDGFAYRRIKDTEKPKPRLDWLRSQLPEEESARRGRFRPQPYRQLASALRAQGSEPEARQILIGMAEDRRKWGDLSWPSRLWQRILWCTIRNGHQPLRATLWLGVMWVIGFIAFGLGYQAHVMVPTERFAYEDFVKTGTVVGQHDPFCALAYAIDLSLPIISFGQKDRWHPMGTATATAVVAQTRQHSWIYSTFCQASFTRHWTAHGDPAAATTLASVLHLYRWIHVALGWFLATMLVAGISGLVGRD